MRILLLCLLYNENFVTPYVYGKNIKALTKMDKGKFVNTQGSIPGTILKSTQGSSEVSPQGIILKVVLKVL